MILCDLNLIAIMSIVSWCNKNKKENLTLEIAIDAIVENLENYRSRFQAKYGDMVIACDSRSYWRKNIFPYYKFKRKESREKSSIDWNVVHGSIDSLTNLNAMFHIVYVEGAEADDVIAVLAKSSKEDVLILSSDKDFVQLQKTGNVSQYNPQYNRFISVKDPIAFTREHIIRGDYGDSIPNFLTADDAIATGQRQKSINTVKLQEWVKMDDPNDFCDSFEKKNHYARNKILIDFDYIPKQIEEEILTEYKRTLAER